MLARTDKNRSVGYWDKKEQLGSGSHFVEGSKTRLIRMWDVSAVTGWYLSMDFFVSDAKGNMIHCSAKATVAHNFLRLKVGSIYSVKNFVVKSNKEEYQILKNDTYMLEFDGSTTIRKALVKSDGLQTSGMPVDLSQPRARTLENVLMWARNMKNNVHDFLSKDKEWMKLPFMWERHLYRLEVDVSDDTAQAVVVMFNETTTTLVKCSADSLMDTTDESIEDHLSLPPALSNLIGTAHVMEIQSHTYYEYGIFKSFTCWQIHPSIEDSVGSSTIYAVFDNQPHKLKSVIL
nr:hypothetical protein [Tanacetum cinerariifolium]